MSQALPTVKNWFLVVVHTHGVPIRAISKDDGEEVWLVLSDIWEWAKAQGALQRPQLSSVLAYHGLKDATYRSYLYSAVFGNTGSDFVSGNAHVVQTDLIKPFLALCGLKGEPDADLIAEFSKGLDVKLRAAAASKQVAADQRPPDDEVKALISTMRKEMRDMKRKLNQQAILLSELEHDLHCAKSHIAELDRRSVPTPANDTASEVRRAASLLYARSKQLERQAK